MKKFMNVIGFVLMAAVLTACGVNTDEHERVVFEKNALQVQLTEKNVTLAKVAQDLEVKKRELATEIKAKQAHAVREEQMKQRLKQAERDLAAALRELSAFKGKKK